MPLSSKIFEYVWTGIFEHNWAVTVAVMAFLLPLLGSIFYKVLRIKNFFKGRVALEIDGLAVGETILISGAAIYGPNRKDMKVDTKTSVELCWMLNISSASAPRWISKKFEGIYVVSGIFTRCFCES